LADDVFISYANHDKQIADAVCTALEQKKFCCWIAPRDVLPGTKYAASIINAIRESKVVVLVFSSHSNKSEQVAREMERAVSLGRPIIPFRIEDVPLSREMEFYISAQHWLDATTPPLEKHLADLAETVAVLRRPVPSLAVLYFDNLGPGSEDDYFVAGMTEDIITDLSKTEKIKVLPRNDVLPYKGRPVSIKETGRELNVEYLMQGSVRKADSKLRINAQLARVSDGFQVWAERFDRQLDDVFKVQADVAQKVARALEIKLTARQIERIEKRPTISIKAYDYYLRGREYYWRLGKEDLKYATNMYEKALEIDSNYALAYAGLADVYVYQYEAYYNRSLRLLDEAEKAAKKALAIDYDIPEAHRALGRVHKERGNNQEAIREFRKAIDLKPDFSEAYRAMGWIYEETRDFDEAILYAEKALDIRPSDRESYLLLGLAHFDKKEYAQALDMFHRAVEVAPDYGTAYYCMGNTYQRQGEFDQALKLYEKCIQVGGDPNVYLDTGIVHLLRSDLEEAAANFSECIKRGCFEFLATYYLGLTSRIQGRKKEAHDFFRRSVELCETMLRDDPDNPYVHSTLGLAFTQLGQHSKGTEHGVLAAALDPQNGAVLYDLARIYAQQGKSDKAMQNLRKALDACLSPSPTEANLDPHFETLHDLPEFFPLMTE
jgi:TolB-like protein/Flp pilus assembly protein TadD